MSATPVSTGIASFDSLIGGGYAPGSLVLIEEDVHAVYSSLFVRSFASESLYCGRKVHSCGQELRLNCLPARVETETEGRSDSPAQIAWRYKSLDPIHNSLSSSKHSYDFALPIDEKVLSQGLISSQNLQYSLLSDLLSSQFDGSNSSVIVIGISTHAGDRMSIPQLVFRLKSMSRSFGSCVVLVTWNPLLHEEQERREVHNIVDAVFQLDAFEGTSAAYPEFDGLFRVHKLAKVNSLNIGKKIETLDLGFQMKKNNRFIEIDKLCLPPDLSETVSRSTCSSTSSNVLDF